MDDVREKAIPGSWWVECTTCGYDSSEAGFLDKEEGNSICPLCAEDCGKDNPLAYRPATPREIIAAYEAALWQSASNPPKEDGTTLIYTGEATKNRNVKASRYVKDYEGWSDLGHRGTMVKGVTHWRPLPQKPETPDDS